MKSCRGFSCGLLCLLAAAQLRGEDAAPYPPSPVIRAIEWAPVDTIVRKARGGDNWPLTWGDDGHLYTAYGDGRGFRPNLEKKLSMGLVLVEGRSHDFRGVNLRAPTLEQTGDGARGRKASGLLMVDGVLYLWARNAGNAQLAWSRDRGATWQWADWKLTESFGCPTFLNFGRNYAGARDEFVYVYSHDSDSAYQPADRMVLARVPADRLRDRGSYEFFVKLDDGRPVWSRDVGERGAVFSHAGRCYRNGISYNAGLKRYLWCQTIPGGDTRFKGGFGIYDAPEPWGPWTTVFYTTEWDVGPGETSSIPTKWIGDDGRTVHLVFSGDDCFSVRKATLDVRNAEEQDGEGQNEEEQSDGEDGESNFVYPGETWERAAPAEVGMDAAKLEEARRYAVTGEGSGYVTRHGKLVLSWGDLKRRYDLKSTTKSIGMTAVGLALADGKLKLSDPASKYHASLGTPPESNARTGWLNKITLEHLATQTSGFEKPGGYGKLLFEPGTAWHYSDAGPNWLAECVTLQYKRDLRDLLFERVFTPIGIGERDLTWRNNAYRPREIAGVPRREFGSGVSANVDAMARFGYLYLRGGRWNGKQLLPREFVEAVGRTRKGVVGLPEHNDKRHGNASDHYGLLWWNNADGTLENVPRDAYWSWGLYDSLIVVIPSLDIVVSRAGKSWQRNWDGHYDVLRPFLEPIAGAAR